MKKILLFICFSVLFVSCKKQAILQVTTKTYDLKSQLNCTAGNCTYVHFEIPVVFGNEELSEPMNNLILNFIKSAMSFENDKKTKSYDTIAMKFINHYNEVYKTYPENSIAWEANFKSTHKNLSNKVYQIVFDYYSFTGGAHGLQATKVFIFDTETGKIIPKKDLFINYEGFKNYAEIEFKKQMNISGNLNAAGFTFEKNQFKLPDNFYENNHEWVLYYNPYEIAPYVQGASIIKLPKEKVEPFLNPIHFKN